MNIARLVVPFILILAAGPQFPSAGRSTQDGLYVPRSPAPGFTAAVGPEFYGTESKPLANGSIFDFIDGGGVAYLRHGFRAVVHCVFADPKQNSVTVDVFDMAAPSNARAIYADETLCPREFKPIFIGVAAKAYHFEPDFYIYFIKSRFLVYCSVNNDAFSDLVIRCAKTIVKEVE